MSLRDTISDNCLKITEELIGPYMDKEELGPFQKYMSSIYTAAQQLLIHIEEDEMDDDREEAMNPPPKMSKYEPKDLSSRGMKLVPGNNK